jgi:pimeloyl-ACP methyl ester carboxylesterase
VNARRLLTFAAVLLAFVLGGCGLNQLPELENLGPEDSVVLSNCIYQGTRIIDGRVRSGALFRLYRPARWNGELILFARGYDDPADPPELPDDTDESPFTDILKGYVEQGYGVAYSSFSENGWAIKDGLFHTKQLIPIYRFYFGSPKKTYVVGASMGGLIAVAMAEQYSYLIDGALSICGPVGGGRMMFEHIINSRVVFDVLFPGVMPGEHAYDVPEGLDWDALEMAIGAALMVNPVGAGTLAAIDQIHMPYDNGDELGVMIGTAMWFSAFGTNDVLARTGGEYPVGNKDVVYTVGGLPLVDLNLVVDRFEASPRGACYLERWYQPTGRLGVPVVTLHTTRDNAVPFNHEEVFAGLVDEAEKSEMLEQISVTAFGHCNLTVDDFVMAFTKLLQMVAENQDDDCEPWHRFPPRRRWRWPRKPRRR